MITGHGKGCDGCFRWMYRLQVEKAFVKHSLPGALPLQARKLGPRHEERPACHWRGTELGSPPGSGSFFPLILKSIETELEGATALQGCLLQSPDTVSWGGDRPQAASKAKRPGLSRAGDPRTLSGTAGQGSPRVQSHPGPVNFEGHLGTMTGGICWDPTTQICSIFSKAPQARFRAPNTLALRDDPEDVTAPRPLLPGLLLTLLPPWGTELHFKNFSEFPWSTRQLSLCILPAPWLTLRHCLPCHAVDAMEGRIRSGHPLCVSTVHSTKEILSDVQLLNCGRVQQRSWDFAPPAYPSPRPSHTQLRSVCPRLIYSSS